MTIELSVKEEMNQFESLRMLKQKSNQELIITWHRIRKKSEWKKNFAINHITFWKSIFQASNRRNWKYTIIFKVIHVWHHDIERHRNACNASIDFLTSTNKLISIFFSWLFFQFISHLIRWSFPFYTVVWKVERLQ